MEYKDNFTIDLRRLNVAEFVNKNRCIPCVSCKEVIYEMKDGIQVKPTDVIKSELFKKGKYEVVKGAGIICPKCKFPILFKKVS